MRRKLITGAAVVGGVALLLASPAGAQEYEPTTQDFLDNTWVLIAGILVLFMQAGFAMLEAGLTRAKNVANIMMKNMMDTCAGVIAFFVIGFSIAYGGEGSFFGFGGIGIPGFSDPYEGGLSPSTDFFFQVVFAATAATIVGGAMAERTKFASYFVYSLVITALIYPIVVRWTWGGGWIADLEFSDFAGSTIVHGTGAWAALMGALILGPRIGKYSREGKVQAIPGQNIVLTVLGTLILFVGWFGFNPGSELAADLAVAEVAVATLLAAAAGGITCMVTIWIKSGKPDVAMTCNGILAGLVSITAGCGTIPFEWCIFVGGVGGVLVVFAVEFIDKVVKVDDPVGAISVHGICGVWGTLAIGLFAKKADGFIEADQGLFFGGGPGQLVTQAVLAGSVFLFVTITTGLLFMAIKATMGLRVSPEEELAGLDVLEHGASGYNDDVVRGIDPDSVTVPGRGGSGLLEKVDA